jgi:outer membrane protein OmpA-like peptidoglycan-associated protein
MRLKNFILSCLAVVAALSVNAQEVEKTENIFKPHWYLQGQIGAQYTLGEISFGDLISPNAQIGVGYNFNKVLGARFSVNAWQSKAGWDTEGNNYEWKWKYVAPALDVTANLSNLICGYNPNRILNIGVFAGIGANIAFDNGEAGDVNGELKSLHKYSDDFQPLSYLWDGTKTRVMGRAGITADCRINDVISVGLELQATTLNDHYNSKRAKNADWYFNALLGVKINLGKTHTTRVVPAVVPVKEVERVVEKVVYKECTPDTVYVVEPLRRDIFFTISCTKIVPDEMKKVKDIADYLNKYPKATVKITGYADKGTGNAKINASLGERRAQAVVDALVKEFGIPASRIKADSKGDTEQPFKEDILNRVSICIAK